MPIGLEYFVSVKSMNSSRQSNGKFYDSDNCGVIKAFGDVTFEANKGAVMAFLYAHW